MVGKDVIEYGVYDFGSLKYVCCSYETISVFAKNKVYLIDNDLTRVNKVGVKRVISVYLWTLNFHPP